MESFPIPVAAPVLGALHERRSVRRFEDRDIPREVLEQILDAAVWAPSAAGSEPWRFVVLQGTRKAEFADLLRRSADEIKPGLNPIVATHATGIRNCAAITAGAPVAVTAWATFKPGDATVRLLKTADLTPLFTWTMVVQSVAAAVQNLLVAAHGLGLGSVWMGYPNLVARQVKSWLQESGELQATIALGYPADLPRERKRKPLEAVVRWEG